MKNLLIALYIFLSIIRGGSAVFAEHKPGHQDVSPLGTGAIVESSHADVKKYQACPHCGMDRDKFAGTRMLITFSDGSSVGLCSIHCTITELKANRGRMVKAVEVADLNTRKLIAVEKAIWVIGGSRKGVMTRVAKWAFEKKDDADAFIRKNGGKLATYKEVLALAEKE